MSPQSRRAFLLLSLCTLAGQAFTQASYGIPELRADFNRASTDPNGVDPAFQRLESAWPNRSDRPPVVRAYAACYIGLRAQFAQVLTDKIKYMNEAIRAFDGVVEAAPQDLETRFLRYSFFIEIPLIAGKRGVAKADLQVLVGMLLRRDYSSVDKETQRGMILHIIKGGELGRKDADSLRELL